MLHNNIPRQVREGGGLTIHRSAGLVNQAVAFDDAVGEGGLAPGHVDRGGGQLAEVDEAGRTRSCDTGRERVMHKRTRSWNLKVFRLTRRFLKPQTTYNHLCG